MDRAASLLSRQNWPVYLWLGLILLSSTGFAAEWANQAYGWLIVSPGLASESFRPAVQKAYHVFLFAVFGWLAAAPPRPRRARLRRGIVLAFAVGAVSEIVQLGFAGRSPAIADVVLNGMSGWIGAWVRVRWL